MAPYLYEWLSDEGVRSQFDRVGDYVIERQAEDFINNIIEEKFNWH